MAEQDPNPGNIRRRGLMLVLSSPSGAGKTTISRALLDRDPNLAMSVSVTTRPKRPGEVANADYRFIDAAAFDPVAIEAEPADAGPPSGGRAYVSERI